MKRIDWIYLALILAGFALAAFLYPSLPDPVPTHFDSAGKADGFMPKPWGVFVLPLTSVLTFALLKILPAISPRGFRIADFQQAYNAIGISLMAFLFLVTAAALLVARGAALNISTVVGIALGLLFMVLGNYMGKVRKNFFVGIRTPWTLASDEVWYRTHRLAGRLLSLAGLIAVIATAARASLAVVVGSILLALLIPVVYSLVIYRQLEGSGPSR